MVCFGDGDRKVKDGGKGVGKGRGGEEEDKDRKDIKDEERW